MGVPLVTEDLNIEASLSEPQPKEICTDVEVEITEVKCSDAVAEKCVDLVKFEDSTNTVTPKPLSSPKSQTVTKLPLPSQPRLAPSLTKPLKQGLMIKDAN